MEREIKQVIVVRNELNLPKGKLAAQVAHAATMALLRANQDMASEWEGLGMAKIVLKVQTEKEMIAIFQAAKDAGLKPAMISDAGKTVVAPGTKTCVGIGPAVAEELDKITGELQLL